MPTAKPCPRTPEQRTPEQRASRIVYWWRLLNWWGLRKFEDWRVRQFCDDLWYVEERHFSHGWVVHPDSASTQRRDAVAWAHRYYARPTRGEAALASSSNSSSNSNSSSSSSTNSSSTS